MRTKAYSSLSIVILIAVLLFSAFADEKPVHDKAFEYVFFGNEDYKDSHPQVKDAIGLLEYAAQLSIDQYSGNSSTYLKFLQNGGYIKGINHYTIRGLPNDLSEIDYIAGPGNHRNYTHMGWYCKKASDFKEIDIKKNKNWPQKWEKRKNIIRGSVDAIFDFDRLFSGPILGINVGYDDRCDSFSALVYYVHILQDFLHDDYQNSQNNGYKILFASMDCNDDSHTLISELIFHSRRLFVHEGKKHPGFDTLERELKDLNNRTYMLIGIDGEISESDYPVFHERVSELKEILHSRLPGLLRNESFFSEVF